MFKYKDTENEVVRLMMFPLSLTGEAKTWLDELNEGTIETWDELRTAFISHFFPPAFFDRLLEEIRAFSQHENKSLTDAWLQVLNAAVGGIFLYKTLNQAYHLLEDKVLLKLDWAKNQKVKTSLKKMLLLPMKNLETKFNRLADKQSGQPSGSLPSNTQPNPEGHNSKAYQPSQSRNEHVNVVFKRSGKSYNTPVNQNDQQNDSETLINFDSDDEDEEPTLQPKIQNPKPVKETPLPKRCFLDMIRAVRINIPLIDVLAGMPNYGKFLKELIRNKPKIVQISAAFLSDESSSMIQNKVPPKLGDPGSFLIPCNFDKTFSCNALADLGARINLIPYSLYAKLSLETLKLTKMSVRLADRSF
ncbi:reverse transcriptase domain-containing protein [Tanacetum coccineum]